MRVKQKMEWDKYEHPACLNPRRIAFGHLYFTTLEHYEVSWLVLLPASESAFEFGCGFGLHLCHLVGSGKVRRGVGIDISDGALKGAAKLAKALGVDHSCEFRRMDYVDLAPKESYQIVLSIQFINYVKDVDSFFELLDRMTDPTSTILIHDAQRQTFGVSSFLGKSKFIRRLLRKSALPSLENPLIYHKSETIKEKANAHGFSIISEFYVMPFFLVPFLEILYHLSIIEFSNKKLLLIAKGTYSALNSLVKVLSKILSNRKNSVWYCLILRKKQC